MQSETSAAELLESRQLLTALSVNTNLDVVDPDDGLLSLREAVQLANETPGDDTIVFDELWAGADSQTAENAVTIELQHGSMELNDPTGETILAGPGRKLLTISGADLHQLFNVSAGGKATIKSVTLANGRAWRGGAIHNRGELEVIDSKFEHNVARGVEGLGVYGRTALGGAIYNTGKLRVLNSTFYANRAEGVDGPHAVEDSPNVPPLPQPGAHILGWVPSINDDRHGGGAAGGAIYNSSTGVLEISDTDFVGNSAVGGDGGDGRNRPKIPIDSNDLELDWGVGLINLQVFTRGEDGGRGGDATGGGIASSGEFWESDAIYHLNQVHAGRGGRPGVVDGPGDPGADGTATDPDHHVESTEPGAADAVPAVPFVIKTDARPDTFDWTTSRFADRYEIWVNDLTNGTVRFAHSNDLTESELLFDEELPLARYRVWVRAGNEFGWSGWSDARTITIGSTPNTPQVRIADTTATDPVLDWTRNIGPYPGEFTTEIWIRDVLAGERVHYDNDFDGSTFDTADLPDGVYKAWVRHSNVLGHGEWSEAVDFTIDRSTEVVLPSRLDDLSNTASGELLENGQVLLEWPEIQGADTYEIWITDMQTRQMLHRQSDIPSPQVTLDGLQNTGSYRLSVRGWNSAGAGEWSNRSWDFGVFADRVSTQSDYPVRPIAAPILTHYEPNIFGDRLTLNWNDRAGAERFEIWITDAGTKQKVLHKIDLTENTFTAGANLTHGRYRIWVRSFINGEASEWSNGLEINFLPTGDLPQA